MVKKSDSVVVPKRALLGIGAAVAITAVLLSKDKTPEVLLFLVGIFCGVIITVNWLKK